MAMKKACNVSQTVKNTGKSCDIAMVATAMLIAVPSSLKFDDTDLLTPSTWLKALIHAPRASRVYPFFGHKAPIREINNASENDVTVTLDDGSTIFIRYGFFNRGFATTSGGICYGESLMSFNQSGYNILEIDQEGKMIVHYDKNATKPYSGLATDFMHSPSPMLADFKAPYKNRFMISYSPVEYVSNGLILEGGEEMLSLMGLIDVKYRVPIVAGVRVASSTTKLKFNVMNECSDGDLVALLGAALADVSNFLVTRVSTGATVVPTAAAIVTPASANDLSYIEITGTFVSGQDYKVTGTAPSVWLTNLIEGYDGETNSVTITIP